jgi:hypothetical protein
MRITIILLLHILNAWSKKEGTRGGGSCRKCKAAAKMYGKFYLEEKKLRYNLRDTSAYQKLFRGYQV